MYTSMYMQLFTDFPSEWAGGLGSGTRERSSCHGYENTYTRRGHYLP